MPLSTRLTEALKISHPIISAPMAVAAGGELAAAVSDAGALGMIGGGYGDAEWLEAQLRAAGNARIGCGFIAWSLAKQPELLELVLESGPAAIFLSFGDPAPFATKIKAASTRLICQIQTLADARAALDCGADIIVAQGAAAGGHVEKRSAITLVPEVADLLAARSPQTLLCAAGGIADGRGLAASLMLGADGVVVGSRLWASPEALVHPNMHKAALAAAGDDTIRSSVMDLARAMDWPSRFTAHVLRNAFTERWHGRENELLAQADMEAARWRQAWTDGETDIANVFVGESVALIHAIEPVRRIIGRMVAEAETLLAKAPRFVVS
jgi:nitronate monooxygenase